jgi:outer membrane protein assembly factor BamB
MPRLSGFAMAVLLPFSLWGENWPQWRGPTNDGISGEKNLAVRWSASENIAWKMPLKGLGTSTPVIWEDRIFLTSQLGDGPLAEGARDFDDAQRAKKMGEERGVTFLVSAFARDSGRPVWETRFPGGDHLPEVHIKHNLASPSCVTDGERVYAWFGTGLAVALTLDGETVWQRDLGKEYTPFDVRWGHGSSPALYKERLLLLVDHPLDSYLLAVDRRSGEDILKISRGKERRSYTTPFIVQRDEGDQLIVNTNEAIQALDPDTGKLIWQVGEDNRVPIGVPVFHNGVLYSNRGYNSSPYLAVGVDGTGDVSRSKLKWRAPTGGPYVSSLTYYQGVLYMANERGIASAVDAGTGETLWKQRLGGVFSASPVAADGLVYLAEESGKTYVIEAGREFKLAATNDLGERTLASPAISGGLLFLRSDDHLFAIKN